MMSGDDVVLSAYQPTPGFQAACKWLQENYNIAIKPACNATFYACDVSERNTPLGTHRALSLAALGPAIYIKSHECDSASTPLADGVLVEYHNLPRKAPIIKRSQLELPLLLMIGGAILVCLSVATTAMYSSRSSMNVRTGTAMGVVKAMTTHDRPNPLGYLGSIP
ncbi:hypothetical protein PybrP1_012278 [[Pythium] brassicae (nom. inval.)]|nr:hypothetical protein PybrP1_012278 [[Pythium] brassicae (nom. inval.)]